MKEDLLDTSKISFNDFTINKKLFELLAKDHPLEEYFKKEKETELDRLHRKAEVG